MQIVHILGAKRSPQGAFMGALKGFSAPMLAAQIIKPLCAALPSNTHPCEALIGCVLSAGLGQAPARQAVLNAGLTQNIPTTTLNKVCGSGMKAVMLGAAQIRAGEVNLVLAGGMESMSNAPYLQPKLRDGVRMGHIKSYDHMFMDGLEDAYERGTAMGVYADATAERYNLSRESQDAYALESLERALIADFKAEICPIYHDNEKQTICLDADESPQQAKPDKVKRLKPAFTPKGTVTAANASSISDGAAMLLLGSEHSMRENAMQSRARIVGMASYAAAPRWFTLSPIGATQKLLRQLDWSLDSIDLFEVNEAFAAVPMAWMAELGVERSRVNVRGGACALGHPIGASGARIIVTLLHALEDRNLKRGIATLCIGGGEATAIALER